MPGGKDTATHKDLLIMYTWIGVIGQTLVKKGLVKKKELIKRIEKIKAASTAKSDREYQAELVQMIKTIEGW
jgi:hypothetical protein